MRTVLVGQGSFIAQSVSTIAGAESALALPRNADLDTILRPDDNVINFAITPEYRSGAYSEDADMDLRVARAAARKGAHFVMLSTRRVYPAERRWNAHEEGLEPGDETAYGRNKAISEGKVLDTCGSAAGIFRLSNIFGYEYSPTTPRRSFLGLLLASLKQKNSIFFDMSGHTQRDFLPVEICASLLLDRARDHTSGIYNLGSGIPTACGQLAGWIQEGYGSGYLVSATDAVSDAFLLNMDKWRSSFDLPVSVDTIRNYCLNLGRRLQCEKY